MKSKGPNYFRSVFAHVTLIILSFMCLFFFYILFVNATRSHADLQKGFSALPGAFLWKNLSNVANDGSFPMFRGIDCFRVQCGDLYLFFGLDSLWPLCL